MEVEFNGRKFNVRQGNIHPAYSFFTFTDEEKDFRDQYWKINEGDCVFDIGSSYGSYALSACVMGATVYAFEPEPTVCCDLLENVRLNRWEAKCFVHNFGLWSSESRVNMKDYAPHWPQQTISSMYEVKTLDMMTDGLNRLDMVKIDVEGAEEHVVKGGLKTIEKFRPRMIVECHIFLDAELTNKIKSLLEPFNYEIEEVQRDPCVMLVANPK